MLYAFEGRSEVISQHLLKDPYEESYALVKQQIAGLSHQESLDQTPWGGNCMNWIPILVPVLFSFFSILTDHIFRFDYLMPAELFPVALTSVGVLTWVAFRAHSSQKLFGWSLVIVMGLLFASQPIVVVTGLVTG